MASLVFCLTWAVLFYVLGENGCNSWQYHIDLVYSEHSSGCKPVDSKSWNCSDLDQCLLKANELQSSVYVRIAQESAHLALEQKHELRLVTSMTLVAPPGTEVRCKGGAGIAFNESGDIHLEGIHFTECGTQYQSTSSVNENFQVETKDKISASLYFISCTNVTLDSIAVNDAPGFGLVLHNTAIQLTISNSIFSNNGHTDGFGGGISVVYSFSQSSNTQVSITNSTFVNNIANTYTTSNVNYFTGYGRGGGLCVIFKDKASNNVVSLSNLTFTNNRAQYGGSLYVAFLNNAQTNNVMLEQSNITNSQVADFSSPHDSLFQMELMAEGGGMMVVYGTVSNQFTAKSVFLENNTAQYNGGSLSVHSIVSPTKAYYESMLSFENVVIQFSSARVGAAAYFIANHDPSSSRVVFSIINMTNCQFKYNKVYSLCGSPGTGLCHATVYASNYKLLVSGRDTMFVGNSATGFVLSHSIVKFTENSATLFEDNWADNGGGIRLTDCSRVLTDSKSLVKFAHNSALYKGGGIYVAACSTKISSLMSSNDCFINMDKSPNSFVFDDNKAGNVVNAIHAQDLAACMQQTNTSQNDLETNILGSKNLDANGYSTQITSGTAYINVTNSSSHLQVYPGEVFNLSIQSYDVNNIRITEQIKICLISGPGSLHEDDPTSTKCLYRDTSLDTIPLVLYSKCDNSTDYETGSVKLSVTGEDPPSSQVVVAIELVPCPNHTQYSCPKCYLLVDQSHGIACANPEYCSIDNSPNYDKCPLTYSVKISRVHCWNFVDDLDPNATSVLTQFIGGMCPYNYRTKFCEPISHFTFETLPAACPTNRAGRLCGRCAEDYCVAVNTGDMECIMNYYTKVPMWLFYIAIELVYSTILFAIVILTRLSLNAGGTSAFIFYCQVLTMKFPGLSYPSWTLQDVYDDRYKYTEARGFTVIYSIANLDFIIPFAEPFCLSQSLTPIQVISLEYIPAVYLLLLTFLVYVWVLLYRRHRGLVYKLTNLILRKNDHQDRAQQTCAYVPYYFESLALIVVLCYTRVVTTSIKFLHSTDYFNLQGEKIGKAFFYDGTLDYFGDSHATYGIVAVLVLAVFIFLPAFFLLIYPLMQSYLRCRVMNRCTFNIYSFSGCFKDGSNKTVDHRYFAGIYLLLRIVVAFLYLERDVETLLIGQISVAIISASLFMTLRPYYYDVFNTIDGLFFVYLALLSGLSTNGYYSVCQQYLIHLPLVIIFIYIIYKLLRCSSRLQIRKVNTNHHYTNPGDNQPLLPDPECEDNINDMDGTFTHRLFNRQKYVNVTIQHQSDGRPRNVQLMNMT